MWVEARYDTLKDHNGQTRRERNTSFNQPSPESDGVPDYPDLLDWFDDVTSARKLDQGSPLRIPYTEFLSWLLLSGRIVNRREIRILRAMDAKYCATINEETEAIAERKRIEDKTRNGFGATRNTR